MTDVNTQGFRISAGQAGLTRSMQALMIGNLELRGFVYRGPFQLADTDQREALLHTLNTEFNTTINLPQAQPPKRKRKDAPEGQLGSLIAYLVVIDNKPVIFYEEDNTPAAIFGFILGRYGIEAARRVTFRDGMLPPPEVPAS